MLFPIGSKSKYFQLKDITLFTTWRQREKVCNEQCDTFRAIITIKKSAIIITIITGYLDRF